MDYAEFYGKGNIGHKVSQRNIMARKAKIFVTPFHLKVIFWIQ